MILQRNNKILFFSKPAALLLVLFLTIYSWQVVWAADELSQEEVLIEEIEIVDEAVLAEETNLNNEESDSVESDSFLPTDEETPEAENTTATDEEVPDASRAIKEDSLNVKADEMSGALVYNYSFNIPPGRNGLSPDLSLSYNSQNADNSSPWGYGWSMSIPSIERMPKEGINNLYTKNYFSSTLGGELKEVGLIDETHGIYGSEIESGAFLRYEFLSDNSWLVTDKKGTQYKFGQTEQSRQFDPADNSKIYRWFLAEVRDTNGNYIRYEYFKDGGQIYPDKIFYTGHGDDDGIFVIEFIRETRSDTLQSYQSGFEVKTNYRISQVFAKVNDDWVKKYELNYASGDNGIRSVLNSITESGQNSAGNVITLPAEEFEYQQKQFGWALTDEINLPVPFCYDYTCRDFGQREVDVNGDGLVDIIRSQNGFNGFHTQYVYINKNGKDFVLDPDWDIPVFFADMYGKDSWGARLVDVNGDNLIDIVSSPNYAPWRKTFINNGHGWDEDSSWLPPLGFVNYNAGDVGTRLTDVNGDGLVDILYGSWDESLRKTFINNGHGWDEDSSYFIPLRFVHSSSDLGVRIFDINGDGLSDLVYNLGYNYDSFPPKVYLNTGTDWVLSPEYNSPAPFIFSNYYYAIGVDFADINGDNLIDIVYAPYYLTYGEKKIFINTGNGWLEQPWPFEYAFVQAAYGRGTGCRLLDINGDGITDFIFNPFDQYNEGKQKIYLGKESLADMLSDVNKSEGATISVDYQATAKYEDEEGKLLNPKLPMNLQTVKQITYDDGLGNTFFEDYEYSGGEYYYENPRKKRFAGFSRIVKTDAEGNQTKTYYHQANETNSDLGETEDNYSKIGRVYRQEVFDNNNRLYQQSVNSWQSDDLGNEREFVSLNQSVNMDYDGNTDHKDKASSFTYDLANGNLLEQINWGEVEALSDGTITDIGEDKKTIKYNYAVGDLAGLVSAQELYDYQDNKMQATRFYYDELDLGQAVKGNLTKEEHLESVSLERYIDIERAYNEYGLIIEEKDPRDKITTITYNKENLYPAYKTNALAQQENYIYDFPSGQVNQMTDVNANDYIYEYDAVGRIISEKIPDIDNPGQVVVKTSYAYDDTVIPRKITKTSYLENSLSNVAYLYLDGLGRVVQQRSQADNYNYVVKDFIYDQRGLLAKESLPYFSLGLNQTSATTDENLYTVYNYDALQRPVSTVNALGTTTYDYDNWQTKITDAKGVEKDLIYDVNGNLIQVNEYNGAEIYETKYNYNARGDLIRIVDAQNNIRKFSYDGLSRRLSATDLFSPGDTSYGTWQYRYDSAGNLIKQTNAKGQVINWTYDELNRVLTEDYPDQAGIEQNYIYDQGENQIGLLSEVVATDLNTKYQYNSLGLVSQETKKLPEFLNGAEVKTQFEYDRQGNITKMVYPNEIELVYEYNNGNLVERVKAKHLSETEYIDIITNYDYSPLGQITLQQYGNGVETVNDYDENKMYNLKSKETTNVAGLKLQNLNYYYDVVGNITKITDHSETNTAKIAEYSYDDLSRLLQAKITDTANEEDYTIDYTYDALGNILSKSDQGSYAYQGNQGDSLANPHAVTSIAEQNLQFVYDNNGNLVQQIYPDQTLVYEYDYNNRLVYSAGNNLPEMVYEYDYTGQRISQKNTDGSEQVFYPNKFINAQKKDGQWIVTAHAYANGQMIATGEDKNGIIKVYFNHLDHLGGTNVVTDEAGEPVQVLDYYPFGSLRLNEQTEEFDEQRKFTGHEYDEGTGLNYMVARYQSGELGRFLSVDPASRDYPEKFMDDPQQLNGYAYSRNNPLFYVDPDGLWNKETGEVESGDTLSDITVQINDMYSTDYSIRDISRLNQIEDPDNISVGQIIIPNQDVPDITKTLNELNERVSKNFQNNNFGRLELSIYFAPGSKGDLKKQNGIFCQSSTCGGQKHENYVFMGLLIPGDAPGNIHYGYIGHSIDISSGELMAAGAVVQSLSNTFNNIIHRTNRPFLTLDLRDNAYVNFGYKLYKD